MYELILNLPWSRLVLLCDSRSMATLSHWENKRKDQNWPPTEHNKLCSIDKPTSF